MDVSLVSCISQLEIFNCSFFFENWLKFANLAVIVDKIESKLIISMLYEKTVRLKIRYSCCFKSLRPVLLAHLKNFHRFSVHSFGLTWPLHWPSARASPPLTKKISPSLLIVSSKMNLMSIEPLQVNESMSNSFIHLIIYFSEQNRGWYASS